MTEIGDQKGLDQDGYSKLAGGTLGRRRRAAAEAFPDRRDRGDRGAICLRGLDAFDDHGFSQSFTYAEMAGMFGNKSGGTSVYGATAWLRYGKLIAPMSVWCNWFA